MLFNRLIRWLLRYSGRNLRIQNQIFKFSNSPTFRRILSGSFWNAILNLWGKGISFIGTVIIVRMIGREAFGEFGMLNTTISMFGMFTTFSISQTATKYIAQYRNSDKEKAGRIIGLSFLFSAVLGFLMFTAIMIFADTLAVKSLNAPHLANSLRLMSIGLLFGALNGAQNGVIAGFEAFKANTLVGIFSSTGLTAIKILFTYNYGFEGAIVGMTVEPVITYSITYFLARNIIQSNQIKIRFKGALNESKILLNYSLPSILSGLLMFPTNWYCMTLLTKSTSGYRELGAYNAANQWYNVLIFIPFIITSSFLPIFSDLYERKRIKEIKRIINNSIYYVSIIFISLSLVFFLFGNQISLLYGQDFNGIGATLVIAIITLLPQGISIVLSSFIASLGRMWYGMWVNLLWCIAILTLSKLLVSQGAIGLLIARLISYLANLIIMYIFYRRWINKKESYNH